MTKPFVRTNNNKHFLRKNNNKYYIKYGDAGSISPTPTPKDELIIVQHNSENLANWNLKADWSPA